MESLQRKIQIAWEGFFFFFWPQNPRMFLNGVAEVDYYPHGQFHCETRQDTSPRSQDQEIPAEQLSVSQGGSSVDFRTSLWASTAIWGRPGGRVVGHDEGFSPSLNPVVLTLLFSLSHHVFQPSCSPTSLHSEIIHSRPQKRHKHLFWLKWIIFN